MILPDLPPDLTFVRLGNDAGDIDFAFEAKRAARLARYFKPI